MCLLQSLANINTQNACIQNNKKWQWYPRQQHRPQIHGYSVMYNDELFSEINKRRFFSE